MPLIATPEASCAAYATRAPSAPAIPSPAPCAATGAARQSERPSESERPAASAAREPLPALSEYRFVFMVSSSFPPKLV